VIDAKSTKKPNTTEMYGHYTMHKDDCHQYSNTRKNTALTATMQ